MESEKIFGFVAQAVTVRLSLCPTNKIAPNKRGGSGSSSWDRRNARTLVAFYDLLAPNRNGDEFPQPPQNSLLEEPQPDDPDDCGEINDYDESDLSSLTKSQRRQGESRLFFGALHGQQHTQGPQRPSHVQFPQPQQPDYSPPQRPYPQPQYPSQSRPQYPPYRPQYPIPQQPVRPQYTPQYHQEPQRPPRPNYPPARPPYASGGFFSNNPYRPPAQQYPSDDIKPVHEYNSEAQMIYRPDLVGGPSGHVVGAKPVRPPQRPSADEPSQDTYKRYPQQRPSQKDRRERPRRLNSNTSSSIVGSFIDLLL